VGLTHHRLAREITRERADDGAVARRLGEYVVCRYDARSLRHVLHDDGRPPRDVLGQIPGKQPAADIVVVADGMADDQTDLLVAVEVGPGLTLGWGDAAKREEERGCEEKSLHDHRAGPQERAILRRFLPRRERVPPKGVL